MNQSLKGILLFLCGLFTQAIALLVLVIGCNTGMLLTAFIVTCFLAISGIVTCVVGWIFIAER